MIPAQKRRRRSDAEKALDPAKGLGSAIARQRRKVQKDLDARQEARRQREVNGARIAIENAKNRAVAANPHLLFSKAIMASVSDAQTAVLRSYGLRMPVTAEVNPWHQSNVTAYTDFSSVYVSYPFHMFSQREDVEGVLRTIATLKGVFQHEFGHIRFTTPWPDVVSNAYPQSVDMKSRPDLHRAWNLLEDQRMENLVVREVPRIGNYFLPMVVDIVLQHADKDKSTPWLFTAGRRYIDPAIRNAARKQFAALHDDDKAAEWLSIVNSYIAASTSVDMVQAVLDADVFLRSIAVELPPNPGGGNGHQTGTGRKRKDYDEDEREETERRIRESSSDEDEDESNDDESDDESDGAGDSSDEDGEDNGDDEDGDGDGDDADGGGNSDEDDADNSSDDIDGDPSRSDNEDEYGNGDSDNADENEGRSDERPENDGSRSVNTDSGNTDPSFDDLLDEMRRQAEDARSAAVNDHDIKDMANDAASRAEVPGVPDAPWSGVPLPDDLVTAAESQASAIAQSLNDFLTTSQPAWVSHTESGILDALAYRTKSVGALDYHRSLMGDANSGLDVHVSMLADVSASMTTDAMEALSVSMYAMARACQSVGIGATFTLWSEAHSTYRIWRNGIVEPVRWPKVGGTDPHMALDDLVHHNPEDASHHLVVIFTDGQWAGDFPGIQQWATPNQHSLLVVYNPYVYHHDFLTDSRGADEAITIGNISEMPDKFGVALKDLLSRKSL